MTTGAQRIDLMEVDSPHALLGFMDVDHPALSVPVRIVTDVLDHVWNGHTYLACSFGYTLISDGEDAPRSVITIPNVDRAIGRAIEASPSRAKVSLHVLSSADFDLTQDPRMAIGTVVPLYRLTGFETIDARVDDISAEITIALRDDEVEPWPVVRATADRFPGVFR